MKILYLPIFEQGTFHDNATQHKRGLYTALAQAGHSVFELDYLALPEAMRAEQIIQAAHLFKPDLIISQFHGADIMTAEQIRAVRGSFPSMRWVNWSGDSWLHSLTAPAIVEMAKCFDWQLIAAPDVLPEYERLGVRAGYWQIAYEPPVVPLPDMPTCDIVFMGNVITDQRRAMLEMLRSLPYKVGIYGDWQHADGHNTYHFAEGESLYKNAKLAIADNVYPDQQNYVSNRPLQIAAAGGALLLHQHVPKMEQLLGWQAGEQFIEWSDLEDLQTKIRTWINGDKPIVKRAKTHVMKHHTYAARVQQLFTDYVKG